MNKLYLTLLALLLSGCQSISYVKSDITKNIMGKEDLEEIKYWVSSEYVDSFVKSKNFNSRKPTMIILHHTDTNDDETTFKIFQEQNVSSHYLVSRSGKIYQFVDERKRAYHAGASYWNGIRDINSNSIGIELSNDMNTPYTEKQIKSLIKLTKDIMKRYNIRQDMVLGHLEVSPGRKIDPYLNFPWNRLAKENIILMCSNNEIKNLKLENDFSWENTLEKIGYNPNNINKSLQSFRIKHFKRLGEENPTQKEMLYIKCLWEKTNKIKTGNTN